MSTIADILKANIGKVTGSIKSDPDSDCDLEINDTLIENGLGISMGIYANVNFLIYPDGLWSIDSDSDVLIFRDPPQDQTYSFMFDRKSLKILNYTLIANKTEQVACNLH